MRTKLQPVNNGGSSFHQAISSILVLAQIFALFPLVGIKSKTSFGLRFTWMSFRTVYSVIVFCLSVSYATFSIYATSTTPVTFSTIVELTFNLNTTFGLFSFIKLARIWPKLMHHWDFVEAILPPFEAFEHKKQMTSRIRRTACIVLFFAILEHILAMASTIIRANKSNENAVNVLFTSLVPLFYRLAELNWWNAIISKWFNVVLTFTWSFMDLFVMIVSIGLAAQFKRLNTDLLRLKGRHTRNDYWLLRRTQYQKVLQLVVAFDNEISKIVFAAFANNLFFICVQIVRGIKTMPSFMNKVYFWFSLAFLIVRTVAVSLFASYIHDESKKPIEVLRSIPNCSWCEESSRFTQEVIDQTVALTGMKFFYLKRKIMLTVGATIATYELVLLQFNTDN